MNSDEIVEYLRNRAERRIMTLDWNQWYNNLHSEREREGLDERGMVVSPPHRHGSDPFCEICDEKIRISEEFYIFFVGGRTARTVTPYHVKCVDRNSDTPGVRTIVQQDKAFRYGPETSAQ
jgi:hypothetical protein